jgi:hypothetical protein
MARQGVGGSLWGAVHHRTKLTANGARHPLTRSDPQRPATRRKPLICREIIGAGEGIRTLDPNLGKVVLYP